MKFDCYYWAEKVIEFGKYLEPDKHTPEYIANIRARAGNTPITVIHRTAENLRALVEVTPPPPIKLSEADTEKESLTAQLLAYQKLMFNHKPGEPFPDGNSYEWHKAEYDRVYWLVFEYSTYKPQALEHIDAVPEQSKPEPPKQKQDLGTQTTLF